MKGKNQRCERNNERQRVGFEIGELVRRDGSGGGVEEEGGKLQHSVQSVRSINARLKGCGGRERMEGV